jgi:septum formation protein
VNESLIPGERAAELVVRLAREKAMAVAAAHPGACIIGADQAAVRTDAADGETILGKPASVAACIDQLRHCSGQTVTFLTAVAVVMTDVAPLEFTDITRVMFRLLDDATIERYVAREMPLDCAGVSLDPSALIGLPLIRLAATLRTVGFALP